MVESTAVEIQENGAMTENKEKALKTPTPKAPILKDILAADLSKVAIFSGAGVDPDGLASQAIMAAIIRNHDESAEIIEFIRGSFDRPQNKTMRQTLAINVKSVSDFDKFNTEEEPFTCIISVDGPSGVCPVLPNFIIDHHEQGEPAKDGNDVRMIGSASAILWEYAMEAGIDFTTEEGAKLATALAIGILTDTRTGAVPSSSSLDFEALSFAMIHRDNKLYTEILNFPKPSYYNDFFVEGWNNKVQHNTVLVTGIGPISRGQSGVISDLAEKYAETDGVNTAVVCAIVDGNIDVSVRSSNNALNVNDFVQNAFGSGGGKRGAGRAVVEMPPLFKDLQPEHQKSLWLAAREIIIDKALQAAGDGARPKKETA